MQVRRYIDVPEPIQTAEPGPFCLKQIGSANSARLSGNRKSLTTEAYRFIFDKPRLKEEVRRKMGGKSQEQLLHPFTA